MRSIKETMGAILLADTLAKNIVPNKNRHVESPRVTMPHKKYNKVKTRRKIAKKSKSINRRK